MSFPAELKYTKDHEWIKLEGNLGIVGITSYALEQLSDVVHLDLPKVGESFKEGDSFGTVESTKTVSDLYMPVNGKVVEVNSNLVNQLETLQKDAYQKGWLVKIEISGDMSKLMSVKDYESYLKDQE